MVLSTGLIGDCFGRTVRYQRESTIIIPRNEAAFKRKTAQAPVAITITPASAGPTARAKFRPSPVKTTAAESSARGTDSELVACQGGRSSPRPHQEQR